MAARSWLPYLYDEGIPPVSEWSESLARAIDECTIFLYFVTTSSAASEHCRREVNFALGQRRLLVNVHLSKTDLPRGLKLTLSNRQAILRYEYSPLAYQKKLRAALRGLDKPDSIQSTELSEFRLGRHRIRPATNQIGDERIEPKAMAVLLALADSAPDPMKPEELLEHVWPDTAVADNVVHKAIARLRRALEDDSQHPAYIETIPRRGYRLIAKAEAEEAVEVRHEQSTQRDVGNTNAPAPSPKAAGSAAPNLGRIALLGFAFAAIIAVVLLTWQAWDSPATGSSATTIAVLPFKDRSPTSDQQWLGDSMAEELIDMLARIDQLRVIARSSTFASRGSDIKTIGRELDVGSVIEGSVLRSGNRVKVTAQLIRVADGSHVWTGRYDEEFQDVFAIQEKIAQELAEAIHDELGLETPSNLRRARYRNRNIRAYEMLAKAGPANLLRGTDEGLRKSIDLHLQVLAIDPDSALAHAEYGWDQLQLWTNGEEPRDEIWAKANAEAERALSLDPALGAAHNLAAWLRSEEGDWEGAENQWKQGLSLSPGHGYLHQDYGQYLLYTGRIEEARAHILRAIDLDPNDPRARSIAVRLHLDEFDYPAAIQQFNILPTNTFNLYYLAYTQYLAGDVARAAETFLKLIPDEGQAFYNAVLEQGGYIGMLQSFLDFQIQESEKPCTNDPLSAARQLAIIGNADQMFECLDQFDPDKAYRLSLLMIKLEPPFARYRDDPRFIATMKRLLPELSR